MNPIARLRARAAAKYQAADKTVLTNVAFVLVITLTTSLLVGWSGYSVYQGTWAPAVEVNNTGFNKSEAKARAEITAFQISLQGSRIRARVAAGTMTNSAGEAALEALNQQAEAISSQVTTDLIDTLLIRDLAAANGVTADPAVVASEWAKETTLQSCDSSAASASMPPRTRRRRSRPPPHVQRRRTRLRRSLPRSRRAEILPRSQSEIPMTHLLTSVVSLVGPQRTKTRRMIWHTRPLGHSPHRQTAQPSR